MAQKDSDIRKIKELLEIMKDNELAEIEIKHGDDKIYLKRCGPQQPAIAAVPVVGQEISAANSTGTTQNTTSQAGPSAAQAEDLAEIKSPIVGTFYANPSPDSEPFIEPGAHVGPQTVVCIIEAMKVMNEIKAGVSGTIDQITVTNGQAVEYGQVLYRVKPD